MAFYGLFIGINRHASNKINELSFARRDAVALHALFTDMLGGDTKLFTDDQATRAVIEEELGRLAACADDDVIVISFSGHGTPTRQLVTYDADLRDLDGTCIPLDVFAGWLARIPARRLVCILDCCFSGGMGAKALEVESTPRDISSVEELLNPSPTTFHCWSPTNGARGWASALKSKPPTGSCSAPACPRRTRRVCSVNGWSGTNHASSAASPRGPARSATAS
jgi:hypothetical protein